MAITFKDVQDRINLDYLNRTDFTSETKRAIVRAIKHYERERFWFNQTATAINASTAVTSLALPADFIALDMVTVKTTSPATANSIVVQRPFERIVYRNVGGASGVPAECAVFNNTLRMWPLADSAYPLTIYYTQKLTELSADTDTNDWLSAAEDLITFHAAADMLQNIIRGRPEDVAAMRDMEGVALASLQRARQIRMNDNEDMALVGPTNRQTVNKTDGGGGGKM